MKNLNYTILVFALFLIFTGCKKEEEKKQEVVLRPVKYIEVNNSSMSLTRSFTGTTKASDDIELSFRNGGVITDIRAYKSQKVKKGQLIARLDNTETQLAYQQSVSALSSAQSAFNTAKSERDRIKSLYEKGSKSLSDYEKVRNSYENALSQLQQAKKARDIQTTQLSYGIIRAPKDGTIAWTSGAKGERVSAGHIFTVLNAGDGIKVDINVPENLVNKVSPGMTAKVTFSAIENQSFDATVLEVSPTANEDSSTYEISLGINKPNSDMRPGMAAEVVVNFKKEENVSNTIVIPVKAVGEDGNGNFVFLIESEDGKTGLVKKHYIELGELTSDGFNVKGGLDIGQKIATAGLQSLLDGQKVSLQ